MADTADIKTNASAHRGGSSGGLLGFRVVAGAWAAGLIALAVRFMDQPWSIVCAIAAVLIAACVVAGFARRQWMIEIFGSLAVTALGVVAGGIVLADATVFAAGALGLIIVGAALPVTLSRAPVSAGITPDDLARHASQVEGWLARVHEAAMLSEGARRVLFHDREVEMVRRNVTIAMNRGDYARALALCDALEHFMGCVDDAQALRAHVTHVRDSGHQEQMSAEMHQLEAILAERDWGRAHQHAAHMRQLYPEPRIAHEVEQRILQAREQYKGELQLHFIEAANRDDIGEAMRLLREMDHYLSREEAAAIAPKAQEVVLKHREHLGASFKLAVSDRRWAEAVVLGEQIIGEFPNTKMADEVRSMIEALRQRANNRAPAMAAVPMGMESRATADSGG